VTVFRKRIDVIAVLRFFKRHEEAFAFLDSLLPEMQQQKETLYEAAAFPVWMAPGFDRRFENGGLRLQVRPSYRLASAEGAAVNIYRAQLPHLLRRQPEQGAHHLPDHVRGGVTCRVPRQLFPQEGHLPSVSHPEKFGVEGKHPVPRAACRNQEEADITDQLARNTATSSSGCPAPGALTFASAVDPQTIGPE